MPIKMDEEEWEKLRRKLEGGHRFPTSKPPKPPSSRKKKKKKK